MYTLLIQKHIKNQKIKPRVIMLPDPESLAVSTPRAEIIENTQRKEHISELKTKLNALDRATGKKPRRNKTPV